MGPMVDETLQQGWQHALSRLEGNLQRLPGFPHTTTGGRWRTSQEGRWTGGFWIGLLWLAYAGSGEERWRLAAMDWCRRLEPRQFDTTTHDMGFLFEPSFIQGYRLTGDNHLREAALNAARSLARRYHPVGEYIQAWDEAEDPRHAGRTIVDTAMNLPILIWAAREGGEASLEEMALKVARTTARHHVRDDGSTYHVVDFDPITGLPRFKGTWQGMSDESCWSRGQAWAIDGFARLGRLTGDVAFTELSRRMADYFLNHLPADGLPYWDLHAPQEPDQPRDSSAAAIAASGLLELTGLLGEEGGERYQAEADRLISRLVESCLSTDLPEWEGIVRHATMDKPRGSAVDESLMFGDYYFVETLFRRLFPERWLETRV